MPEEASALDEKMLHNLADHIARRVLHTSPSFPGLLDERLVIYNNNGRPGLGILADGCNVYGGFGVSVHLRHDGAVWNGNGFSRQRNFVPGMGDITYINPVEVDKYCKMGGNLVRRAAKPGYEPVSVWCRYSTHDESPDEDQERHGRNGMIRVEFEFVIGDPVSYRDNDGNEWIELSPVSVPAYLMKFIDRSP